VGGRHVKACRRFGSGLPGGGTKPRRGAAFGWVSPPVGDRRTHRGEQSPEGEGVSCRRSFGCRQARPTTGGQRPGTTRYGSAAWSPREGKPWTWLRDGTSPQGTWRSKPSRAGGTPRTERNVELGAPRGRWTPPTDVAKREHETPEGARSCPSRRLRSAAEDDGAGHRLQRTLKRTPARGRMHPAVKRWGTVERTGLEPTAETLRIVAAAVTQQPRLTLHIQGSWSDETS
jgi:hypothetical protein